MAAAAALVFVIILWPLVKLAHGHTAKTKVDTFQTTLEYRKVKEI